MTARTRLICLGAAVAAMSAVTLAQATVTPIPSGNYYEDCPTGVDPDGVALQGDNADDVITGTPNKDLLKGGGGDDTISGLGDDDCLFGQDEKDDITGAGGDDLVKGNKGADTIAGDADDDTVKGSKGPDEVVGGSGKDTLAGGKADDLIKAADGEKDKINCGPQFDTAKVDPIDKVNRNCEKVQVQ